MRMKAVLAHRTGRSGALAEQAAGEKTNAIEVFGLRKARER